VYETADVVVPGCLLLLLAWAALVMWRSVKPPRYLFNLALVPALVASGLVALQLAGGHGATLAIATMYVCVAAVVVPFAIITRHQLVRVIEVVFPIARLVRRRSK
jgi:hypothetical protein